MTNWVDFSIVFDNLIKYFTGNSTVLAATIILIFMAVLLMRGFDFRYATIMSMPLLGGFLIYGWFGVYSWVVNAIIIIAAVFYAVSIIKLAR